MRIRAVSILFICVFAYYSMAQTNDDNTKKYFSGMNFPNFEEPNSGLARAVQYQDTLVITLDLPNRGKDGGRKEKIVIYRDNRKKLNAQFTRDTISSYEKESGALEDVTRVIDVTKTLTLKDEGLVNLFIHRILELNLNQELYKWNEFNDEEEPEEIRIFIECPTHIEIRNSSSELHLSFMNIDRMANTWYAKIRNQIYGELIKGN